MIYELNISQDVMREDNNNINTGFKYLIEEQDSLAAKKWVPNVDGSKILDINAGGSIISITGNTMTHITGKLCGIYSSVYGKSDF